MTKERFHGHLDNELIYAPGTVFGKKLKKHIIIQERDISYRFYSHFHPYARVLKNRLLKRSVDYLQSADTEYEPSEISLPGSVEVAAGKGAGLSLPGNAIIEILDRLSATIPEDGSTIDLSEGMQLRLSGQASAKASDGLRAVLFDGMAKTPPAGSVFGLPAEMAGSILSEAKVVLTGSTGIILHDGKSGSIGAGSKVLISGGTQVLLPGGAQVTLVRSKPRPIKELYSEIFTQARYNPSKYVQSPYPVKDLDFSTGGAYSVYNWELFFHVPLMIGVHLSKNQRFAESQHWFHYIFDPTDDSQGPTPERFWKVRPFQTTDVKKIEEILVNLSTNGDPALRDETVQSIEAWKDAPFRPHVIARYRQQAYMHKTAMAYIDNLIAWGDSLFAQDTGEAIDEATMIYVLAANILGPKPQPVPKKGSIRPQTYSSLRSDLKQFGVVMREAEAAAPFDLMPFPTESGGDSDRLVVLRSIGRSLYFCVPRNDMLLGYWDNVADRLFKIRNSLNIHGIFRQLPLFEPPIDPALLARATAAGLDVGAIVNGLNQPLPLVRFRILVQKAAEICQEVKSLGQNLLSAMEKEDGEAMAILRARHERAAMDLTEHVKYGQLQDAIKAREGLSQALVNALFRYRYYELLLGAKPEDVDNAIPNMDDLHNKSLEDEIFPVSEPGMALREIRIDIAEGGEGSVGTATLGLIGAGDITGGKKLSRHEVEEQDRLEIAQGFHDISQVLSLIAQGLIVIPEFGVKFHFWGLGGDLTFGGKAMSKGAELGTIAAQAVASRLTYEASRSGKMGTYQRREQDWAFQSNLAAGEINLILKQLRGAQIREAIAQRELTSHRKMIEHAEEIEFFLTGEKDKEWTQNIDPKEKKVTNKAMYTWMKREVKGLYSQSFQFAFEVARKAERALQHEIGDPNLSYLQFGYLSGKEGLLAGERLYMDIRRMEMAYHELCQREYELTKSISLLQVDPMALLKLRSKGSCTVSLPEAVFDMDGPGHYFRRIKTVALSIPCVTGPYASINCTLTLLKSSIRKTPVAGSSYGREDAEDSRFSDYFGSLQSIVTSSAQNDSGTFGSDLNGERYLPFEGSGVISEWKLELPADPSKAEPRQFDYDTISDVILHIRYTAREGGIPLRNGAMENLKSLIKDSKDVGLARLFSVRHEFPSEWAKFNAHNPPENQRCELALNLRPEHYPFWSQGRLKKIKRVDIFADSPESRLDVLDRADENDEATKKVEMVRVPEFGGLLVGMSADKEIGAALPQRPISADGESDFKIYFKGGMNKTMKDLWIAITWSDE